MSREEFIDVVTADQPDPPRVLHLRRRAEREGAADARRGARRELTPLSLDDVLALAADGAQLLDTRASADFAGAHLRGSVNIGLDGSYATWAGTLLDHDAPDRARRRAGREQESAMRLGRIGFDNVAGYLEGGMLALDSRPELVERLERTTAATLAEQLA